MNNHKNKHYYTKWGAVGVAMFAAQLALTSSALADLNPVLGFDPDYYYVDQALSPATTTSWGASNSTDLFGETATSVGGVGSGLDPDEAAANSVQAVFDTAIADLNAGVGTLGSAAAYQQARVNLDADPGNAALQEAFGLAQQAYNTNLTTVTNLEGAAVVSSVSYNTFSGASNDPLTMVNMTDSDGAAADAQSDAALASAAISDVTDYFTQGAGASTTSDNYADLEGEVIDPLRDLDAVDPADDLNNNGFLDSDESDVVVSSDNLSDAQSDYDAVLGNPASTTSDIALAAGDLANAQTAYSSDVETLYDNFAPITQTTQEELLGSVLNGSWERDAINSLSQEQVDQASDIDVNELAISDNASDIDVNELAISDNASDIDVNELAISDNASDIDVNELAISDNASDIDVNELAISDNASDIDVNELAISDNASDIDVNELAISDNASDIDVNELAISDNASDIDVNELAISDNASDIDVNELAISDNASDIDVNELAISDNASDIDVNELAISDNASDIDTNSDNIQQEVEDRSALISDQGPNADGNQVVHIGDNSLITEELEGTQRLRAEDGAGDNIDIRFDGDAGVIVDNFVEVTAPDEGTVYETDNSATGSLNPATDESTPTTTPVVTRLGTTTGTEVDGASGGVLLENNGNVTLSQGGGVQTSIEVIQATTFDVYNAGQPDAGQPVPGTQEYVAGYVDGNDDFIEVSPAFATQAELQNWIETTPLSDPAFDDVREIEALEGLGGNLQVAGNANVDGLLTIEGLDTDVASAISDEEQARLDADFALGQAIQAEEDARIIADTQIRQDFAAADVVLQNQITSNADAIASNARGIKKNKDDIETNARGIAMVAALQHTTVLPGMTNAFDFGVSHFEGESGMSLNYARRINENWQVNFGAASTTDFDESVVKAGVGVQW